MMTGFFLVSFCGLQDRGLIIQISNESDAERTSVFAEAHGHAYHRVAGEIGDAKLVARVGGNNQYIIILHKILNIFT